MLSQLGVPVCKLPELLTMGNWLISPVQPTAHGNPNPGSMAKELPLKSFDIHYILRTPSRAGFLKKKMPINPKIGFYQKVRRKMFEVPSQSHRTICKNPTAAIRISRR